eukprot:4698448-Amphidinium_carterae.1
MPGRSQTARSKRTFCPTETESSHTQQHHKRTSDEDLLVWATSLAIAHHEERGRHEQKPVSIRELVGDATSFKLSGNFRTSAVSKTSATEDGQSFRTCQGANPELKAVSRSARAQYCSGTS